MFAPLLCTANSLRSRSSLSLLPTPTPVSRQDFIGRPPISKYRKWLYIKPTFSTRNRWCYLNWFSWEGKSLHIQDTNGNFRENLRKLAIAEADLNLAWRRASTCTEHERNVNEQIVARLRYAFQVHETLIPFRCLPAELDLVAALLSASPNHIFLALEKSYEELLAMNSELKQDIEELRNLLHIQDRGFVSVETLQNRVKLYQLEMPRIRQKTEKRLETKRLRRLHKLKSRRYGYDEFEASNVYRLLKVRVLRSGNSSIVHAAVRRSVALQLNRNPIQFITRGFTSTLWIALANYRLAIKYLYAATKFYLGDNPLQRARRQAIFERFRRILDTTVYDLPKPYKLNHGQSLHSLIMEFQYLREYRAEHFSHSISPLEIERERKFYFHMQARFKSAKSVKGRKRAERPPIC